MGNLFNAASAVFRFFEEGYRVDLNWIGSFVKIIVESVGLVGVGVIVFTLVLKAITTPFDIYQRIKMRKQTLIMRNMQDDLEKLKKQYANDKTTYNLKMAELQKKNGYSMFGACLPMIVSIVILFVAVFAFQSYSRYGNLSIYEQMSHAYNEAVYAYSVNGTDYKRNELLSENEPFTVDGITYTFYKDTNQTNRLRVEGTSENCYIFYQYSLDASTVSREYRIDIDKLYTNQQNAEIKAEIQATIDGGVDLETACIRYFQHIGAEAAATYYREECNPSFLWIKNVWYPDVSYSHPIQDYSTFASAITDDIISEKWEGERKIADVITEDDYNLLTLHLAEEKEQANGYFIMIIITIGLMVLSQYISMRSQKESAQYQTLDGKGARTQKIMLIAIPLIYAVTGFMWTAAFSIYIAVSSIFSILVTLLSNLIIGRIFKKKEEAEMQKRYTRRLPWQIERDKNDKNKK